MDSFFNKGTNKMATTLKIEELDIIIFKNLGYFGYEHLEHKILITRIIIQGKKALLHISRYIHYSSKMDCTYNLTTSIIYELSSV